VEAGSVPYVTVYDSSIRLAEGWVSLAQEGVVDVLQQMTRLARASNGKVRWR